MNYLVFIIGALAGGAGAFWALWKRTQMEMADNIRLRQEARCAFGNGYQEGFVAGERVRARLNQIKPGLVLEVKEFTDALGKAGKSIGELKEAGL